jgi:hypothetical protein
MTSIPIEDKENYKYRTTRVVRDHHHHQTQNASVNTKKALQEFKLKMKKFLHEPNSQLLPVDQIGIDDP